MCFDCFLVAVWVHYHVLSVDVLTMLSAYSTYIAYMIVTVLNDMVLGGESLSFYMLEMCSAAYQYFSLCEYMLSVVGIE